MPGTTDGADFVTQARAEIERRIAALEPLLVEFHVLRITLAVIECWVPRPDAGPGTRGQQVLATIAHAPGGTPTEIAATAGLSLPKVYPVLRLLESEGYAHRTGRRWYPGPAGAAIGMVLRRAGIGDGGGPWSAREVAARHAAARGDGPS